MSMHRPGILVLACGGVMTLVGCGSTSSASPAGTATVMPTATATATATVTVVASPGPSPTAVTTPTPIPPVFPVAGHIMVTSLGINVPFTASCGDELTYVPTGDTVCYWNFTGLGGSGWYAFAGSARGPLSALSGAHAGAIVTWTTGGATHTRKLSGSKQTIPRDPATGQFGGHDIPPGQHVFLEVRDSTQEVEYDGAP
jgi:hypothetical protein